MRSLAKPQETMSWPCFKTWVQHQQSQLWIMQLPSGIELKYEQSHTQTPRIVPYALRQKCLRIVIPLSGVFHLTLNQQTFVFQKNVQNPCAYILPINQDCTGQKVYLTRETVEELVLFIPYHWLEQLFVGQEHSTMARLTMHLQILPIALDHLVMEHIESLLSCDETHPLLLRLALERKVMHILEAIFQQLPSLPTTKHMSEEQHLIQKIIWLIEHEEHDTSHWNIKALAKACHINPTSLQKVFKNHMKCSIGQYIREQRLLRARQALLQGKSVTDAALIAHYQHIESFSHAFLQMFHCNPKTFKQSATKKLPNL